MAKEVIYRCDKAGCNLTRPAISETNHWFTIFSTGNNNEEPKQVLILPFDANNLKKYDLIFCGEAHALEYIGTELPKLFPVAKSHVIEEDYVTEYPSNEMGTDVDYPELRQP